MLTKTPDYMISECGYPELWNSDSKHLPLTKVNSKFWNSYSSWCSNKSTKFAKLLPLRESWTDYYTKNYLQRQSEESQKYSKLTTTSNHQQKQQKNHHNELTKKRSFHFNRRSGDANGGVGTGAGVGVAMLDAPQRRSRTKTVDNDIDQF